MVVQENSRAVLFESVFEKLKIGITISDQNGGMIYINRYGSKLTGYTEAEVADRNWSLLYSSSEARRLEGGPFAELLSTGFWQGLVYMRRKDGTEFPSRLNLTFLDDTHFVCVFDDDTDAIAAEAKLADLSLAVASTMDGIALMGPDGRYTYLNEKHIKHFGYENEAELLGSTWRVFYPPHEISRIEQEVFPQLARDGRYQGETLGICKDGTRIYQEITLTGLSNGGMICIMRNIGEKKERENDIKKLALVADKTNNAVIITNRQHRIEWVNEAAESIFSMMLADVRSKCIHDVLPQMVSLTDMAIEQENGTLGRNGISSEIEYRTCDGQKYWLYCDVSSVTTEHDIGNYVYILIDITRMKEAEANLKESLNKERELNALKTSFITLASHEFRTPLASIQSSMDVLRMHLALHGQLTAETLSRHLDQVSDEVSRMTYLMNDVLVMGKINANKMYFKAADTDLESLVARVISSPFISRFGRQIKLLCDGTPRLLSCDPRLIEHIVYNLVDNALKYSAESIRSPYVRLIFEEARFTLEVVDYGIGVPEADSQQLFDSFYRGSNVKSTPGTGLGLSIVQKLAETHCGRISYESNGGEGSVFRFTMPI